jgi:hypothetical protein
MHSASLGSPISPSWSDQKADYSSLAIILEHDLNYFKRRGLKNTFVAFSMLFFWFFILPGLLKPFWFWWTSLFSSPYTLYFVSTVAVADGTYLFINLIFIFLYWLKHPLVDKFKVLEDPWPWESDPKLWKETLKKTLWNLFLNNLIILPGSLFIFNNLFGFVHKYKNEDYPSTLEIILNFVVLALSEDTMFYWTHRLLHYGWFYRNIHKKHHEYFFLY